MTAGLRHQIGQLLGKTVTQWSALAVVGSFTMYAAGYVAVRFRLTALGLGADLELLDERYVFEGVKFLIYLAAAAPMALGIFSVIALAGWVLGRLAPTLRDRAWRSWSSRAWPMVAGIFVSVALVQLFMRQCFLFDNLLLREELPEPRWFAGLLLEPTGVSTSIYLAGLLTGTLLTCLPLTALPTWNDLSPVRRILAAVLMLLIAIEIMLLPINYGILLTGRSVPRVGATIPPLAKGTQSAWLVWEGKGSLTFFMSHPAGPRLATVKSEVERLDIVGYNGLADLRREAKAALEAARQEARNPSTIKRQSSSPWQKLARLSGITATPTMQRETLSATGVAGDLYLVPASGGQPQRLTQSGGLRSPIFLPGDSGLLALRGDELLHVRIAGGQPEPLVALRGVQRLIGINEETPNLVICLGGPQGPTTLYEIDLFSKIVTALEDLSNPVEIGYLLGDNRDYGETRLRVTSQASPIAQWTEVMIQHRDAPPHTIMQGQASSGRQPALSSDGQFVAFIRLPNS